MKPLFGNTAGIDVHKKMLAVIVRRHVDGKTVYEKRKFGTTRDEIEHLAAWLKQQEVVDVVMESTAQYWRPVWYGLEPHFRLPLSHPLKTKAPRGRKTDFRDAQRWADRWTAGDLEESFVPEPEQRSWRWLTRTRLDFKVKIGVVRNQIEGLLEQGGIKLAAVVSDLFGVSGWAMLKLISQGETDAAKIAAEARGTLRKKKAALAEALAGRLDPVYLLLLRQYLEQIETVQEHIAQIHKALGEAMKPPHQTLERLCRVPGIDLAAAQEILAEIGPNVDPFASAGKLASWVGVCPGNKESAGISYSHRAAKGNRYLRRLFSQIAWAAVRTKGTFFESMFYRLLPKIESQGAAWAVAHRIVRLIWLMLKTGVEYIEKGPTPMNPRTLVRKLRRLAKQFEAHGLDPKSFLPEGVSAQA